MYSEALLLPEVPGSHPNLAARLFLQNLHCPSDLVDQGTQVYPAEVHEWRAKFSETRKKKLTTILLPIMYSTYYTTDNSILQLYSAFSYLLLCFWQSMWSTAIMWWWTKPELQHH